MKKFLATVAAVLASALIAYGASVPSVPSNPTYSDPSAIISTLNTFINQLNGAAGYAPAQNIALGSSSVCTSATSTAVCNSQRGVATYTGVAAITTGGNATFVITDSAVNASSQCYAQFNAVVAAGSGPYVSNITPTAGSLSLVVINGGTTTTGAAGTFVIAFQCL